MSINWDKYIPPEVVAKIRKDLLSKDANVFYGDDPGKYGSRRYKVRRDNNMRVRGGTISPDGKLFYDVFKKRWIKLERAILLERITFTQSNFILEEFMGYIAKEENGFMMALIPLLSRYDAPTSDRKNLTNRLHWLTLYHKQGGQSRNFIDPFFHNVLDVLEQRLNTELKKVVDYYG